MGPHRDVPGGRAQPDRRRREPVGGERQNAVPVQLQRVLDILHQLDDSVRAGRVRGGARPDGGDAAVTAEAGAAGPGFGRWRRWSGWNARVAPDGGTIIDRDGE